MSEKKNTEIIKNETKINKKEVLNNNIKLPAFVSLESALGAVSMLAMKSANHKHLFVSDGPVANNPSPRKSPIF